MPYSGARAVSWARTQVGFHEGRNNWNPYSEWQYGNPNNPWCASFQCMAQYIAGYRFQNCSYGEKGEAYTPTEKLRAQQQGTWRDKNWRAQPGDAVLYDWGNNGLIDHVEVVVYDDGYRVITIGGNTSDSVLYRTRDRSYISGFWALSQDKAQNEPVISPEVLKYIAKIQAWQKRVTEKPLRYDEDRTPDRPIDTQILKDLLVDRGLLAPSQRLGGVYGKATAAAVNHLKRLYPEEFPTQESRNGKIFGGKAAKVLIARKPVS